MCIYQFCKRGSPHQRLCFSSLPIMTFSRWSESKVTSGESNSLIAGAHAAALSQQLPSHVWAACCYRKLMPVWFMLSTAEHRPCTTQRTCARKPTVVAFYTYVPAYDLPAAFGTRGGNFLEPARQETINLRTTVSCIHCGFVSGSSQVKLELSRNTRSSGNFGLPALYPS